MIRDKVIEKYHFLVWQSAEYAKKMPNEIPNYYDLLINKLFKENPWLYEAV